MNTLKKIKKGSDYLVDQTEKKLKTLGVVENSTFTPTNPTEYKKYKTNAEFRLRYVEEVRTLSIEYIKMCSLMTELVDKLNKEEEIDVSELDFLKKQAVKLF
tara:strand:+ start:88 stop:393 length:306 start_codon:yes stop_codon:yes gene_type:complete